MTNVFVVWTHIMDCTIDRYDEYFLPHIHLLKMFVLEPNKCTNSVWLHSCEADPEEDVFEQLHGSVPSYGSIL
jgi:hypothetical protein